jgi:hypothetical protein
LFTTNSIPKVDPSISKITVLSTLGEAIEGATIVAIADNDTTKSALSKNNGIAELTISTRRNYQLLVSHPEYPGAIVQSWDSAEDLRVTLASTDNTGSLICMGTGYIPGLQGRLNPILGTGNRTYLYADNIAIDKNKNQPAAFSLDVPFELEDCDGVIMQVRVLHIQGRTSLLQFVHAKIDC